MKIKNSQFGFTLIELLVVISVISLMASIILVGTANARKKARDTVRKQTLKQLQTALELYYTDYGVYPETVPFQWRSSSAAENPIAVSAPNDYIPGLAPQYIAKLPQDPRPGNSLYCPDGWQSAYMYESNGQDYKLLSHCAPEFTITPADSFYDPSRPTWAIQVSSSGGASW